MLVIYEKYANILQGNVTNLIILEKKKILAKMMHLVPEKHQTHTKKYKSCYKGFEGHETLI